MHLPYTFVRCMIYMINLDKRYNQFIYFIEHWLINWFIGSSLRVVSSKKVVPEVCQTWRWHTSEDECKWFIAIWFILLQTEQNKTMRYSDTVSWILGNIYMQMVAIHSIYVLCARCVLFVTPDSSSRLPCCSIRLCLEGRALPHIPDPGWPRFPQAPGTFPLLRRTQVVRYWLRTVALDLIFFVIKSLHLIFIIFNFWPVVRN